MAPAFGRGALVVGPKPNGPNVKPDATKHKPDPAYVRKLLNRAGLSQREAARVIGVTDRAMRFWCSDDPKAPSIPYTAQFALECLAAPD